MGVSGEADLLLGVQGNQQGYLMKVVFHQGQGNQEGVPCKTDLSSCVNGNQEGVPREGVLSSGVKATMRSVHHEGVLSLLSFQGNNWDPEVQNILESLHCCLSKALAAERNTDI